MGKTTQQHLTIQMDPDLPLHNYNGVMGGVTQTGEIEMNFFAECDALPEPAEFLFTESGELVASEQQEDQQKVRDRHVLRTIYSRVLLNPDQAPYKNSLCMPLPNARNYVDKIVNIPCSSNLTAEDVKIVCDEILDLTK